MSIDILSRLQALADPGYRLFQAKLMPGVDPERILGVRTPALRALARELRDTPEAAAFLAELPHRYYDEMNLHGFLIAQLREFDAVVAALDAFLPYVDNWATCDLLSPKVFRRNRDRLAPEILRWIASDRLYAARFGLEMLMTHYLDEDFDPLWLERAAEVRSEEYYLNMMLAWLFATALAKQWDAALPYLTEHRLDVWVHNKTIRKAIESYRITPEQKTLLRSLRIRSGK